MIYYILYPFFFALFRLLARVLGRVQASGEQNVPRTGGVLLCPNHISDADPPTLFVCIPRRAWYVGKSELFAIPVFGWIFAHMRGIPIKRDSADRKALRRAEAVLKAGEPLVIFPEGRCSESGCLQRVQPGAALLAVRTGVPIVPVGLKHTNEMLPYRAQLPRFSRHRVQVVFGEPIHPQDYAGMSHGAAIAAITQRLSEDLARLTNQPPPPFATAAKEPPAFHET